MKIQTKDQWDEQMRDTTKYFFVTLGTGGRQSEINDAAERQASRNQARQALWVSDVAIIPNNWNSPLGSDCTFIAGTYCFKRHVVARFRDSDLPADELDTRIDDAFYDAFIHDQTPHATN